MLSRFVPKAPVALRRTARLFSTKVAAASEVESFSFTKLLQNYASLTKAKLGSMVAVSAIAGYLAAPGEFKPIEFGVTTMVAWLSPLGDNSLDRVRQRAESDHGGCLRCPDASHPDKSLTRWLNVGKNSLTGEMPHATAVALVMGLVGPGLLCACVNNVSAGLAAGNILLYGSSSF